MDKSHYLYRHFSAGGTLLYVGRTKCLDTRISMHKNSSPWFPEVCRIEIVRYASLDEVSNAECLAIRSERPLHNTMRYVKPSRITRPPQRKYTTFKGALSVGKEEVLSLLKKECEKAGSRESMATALGMAPSYVSLVLSGRREPAEKMLEAIVWERVVTYEWKKQHERRDALITADEVRNLLKQECERAGSQRAWAEEAGVSHATVSCVLSGKREPAGKVLDKLELVRVVSYRRKAKSYE